MFYNPPATITTAVAHPAKNIATLFGELSLPVAVALMCLCPRPTTAVTEKARAETASRLRDLLSIANADPILASEPWIQPGAVYEVDGRPEVRMQFLDVQQWIDLLRLLSQYPPQQSKPKRKRDEPKSGESAVQTEEELHISKKFRYELRSRYVTRVKAESGTLRRYAVKVDEYGNMVGKVEHVDSSTS
jgi:hypothetical protein